MWPVTFLTNRQTSFLEDTGERFVEPLFLFLPIRKKTIHIIIEAFVVAGLDQMAELVDYDIFHAFQGLLNQIEINPDPFFPHIAGTPSGFHDSYMKLPGLHLHDGLPVSKNLGNQGL